MATTSPPPRPAADPRRVILIVGQPLLAAVAMRLWHLHLFKRHMDDFRPVAAYLVVAFALVILLREASRRFAACERGRLASFWAGLDGHALAFVAFFLLLFGVQHYAYVRAASDGRAYFLMTRSLVIDRDVQFAADRATFLFGGRVESYALGTALLWVPFFVAAHLWQGMLALGGATVDMGGFSNPYQRAVGIGSLVYGMAGLLLIHRLVCRYYPRMLATLATLAVSAGGFLAWYMAVDASWSHAASMLSVAAFVLHWDRTRPDRTERQWIVLGALAGLATLVRWQNLLFVVLPLAELVRDAIGSAGDRQRLVEQLRRTGLATGAALVVFAPQPLLWRFARGGWFDVPAGDHPIYWDAPYLWHAFFSPDRGLFTWTPLLLFALLGLVPFVRRQPFFGALLVAAFGLQLYINATLWWGGHGFGARRFANCAVIFALGLAAALDWARRRPLAAPALGIGLLTVANGFFMLEIHGTDAGQGRAVSFERMVAAITRRVGDPMAFPASALYAWRYGGDWQLWGRLDAQDFNNLPIDLGAPDDGRFLGGGWSARERDGDTTFRWAIGRRAWLLMRAKEAADYEIILSCAPFEYPGASVQEVELVLNGRSVGRVAMRGGLREYVVEVNARDFRRHLNALELRFGRATAPRELQAASDDARPLAVRCDRVEFHRR